MTWKLSSFSLLWLFSRLYSIVLPIIANGFLAIGLIVLAHLQGNGASALADHILYGWVFFTLVTLLLIAIGMTFAERAGSGGTPPRLQVIRGCSNKYACLVT